MKRRNSSKLLIYRVKQLRVRWRVGRKMEEAGGRGEFMLERNKRAWEKIFARQQGIHRAMNED
jgi:hypothetical protein